MPRRSATIFTDAFVRAARAGPNGARVAHYDGQTAGLELRVTAAGAKTWAFRYRAPTGRTVRLVLGEYPALSLKEARNQALAARRCVSLGGDPRRERQVAREAARAAAVHTFADAASAYLEASARRNRPSTVALDTQRLRTHLLPRFGALPLTDIARSDVRAALEEIGRGGHAVTANRVAALGGKIVRFANDDFDLQTPNPFLGFRSFYEESSRSRVLSEDELRRLWRALVEPPFAPVSEQVALCLRLCALTLQRGQEVAGMDIAELDLDQRIWVIPGRRTKNSREHVVPLANLTIETIRSAARLSGQELARWSGDPRPLFPSPRGQDRAMTRHALTRAMARLSASLEIDDARPHDLRRTGATFITGERIAMPRFVVSAVLNHASEMGGITSIYDRNHYLAEKRRALESWADLLAKLAG